MTDAVRIEAASPRGIVYVHSRGFKPTADKYVDLLHGALRAGLGADFPESLDILSASVAYLANYGDLTNDFLRTTSGEYDEHLDLTDLNNVLHELEVIDRRKGFGVNRYDRLPGKSAVSEFAVSVFSPILSAVGLEKKIVSEAHKDLGEYWNKDSDYGCAVLKRVRDTILQALDRHERVLLIAHGSGAIVAYDALWELSHDSQHAQACAGRKIETWLTLGSPLGDSTVRGQLQGAGLKGRGRYPVNVLAWHNISAEDDYVSHDNTVADDYRAMLKQRQISSIRDYHIYNMAVRYGRSNPHNIIGYLIHPRTARIVNAWLTQTVDRPGTSAAWVTSAKNDANTDE